MAVEDVAVGLLPSSPSRPSFSLRCAHSLDGVRVLSLHGLFLLSDGSLLAISPVGAGATVVCGSGVPTTSAVSFFLRAFFLAG